MVYSTRMTKKRWYYVRFFDNYLIRPKKFYNLLLSTSANIKLFVGWIFNFFNISMDPTRLLEYHLLFKEDDHLNNKYFTPRSFLKLKLKGSNRISKKNNTCTICIIIYLTLHDECKPSKPWLLYMLVIYIGIPYYIECYGILPYCYKV